MDIPITLPTGAFAKARFTSDFARLLSHRGQPVSEPVGDSDQVVVAVGDSDQVVVCDKNQTLQATAAKTAAVPATSTGIPYQGRTSIWL